MMEIVIQKLTNHHVCIQVVIVDPNFVVIPNIIHRSISYFFSRFIKYFLFINRRGTWRDQRPGGGNNRRGGQANYSSKQNQRSDQTQYTSSRSSEQSTNTRQQYKTRANNRYTENLSPHEGRDSPLQIANDETTRGQRMNSGSFSQGQNSGPTSPSTAPSRMVYSRSSGQQMGRNSPAPYTGGGSSSSRNNSITATSPPPASTSYQTNPAGSGNYSQQSNNKMNKKQPRSNERSFLVFKFLVFSFEI
jgi:hypothetical protein